MLQINAAQYIGDYSIHVAFNNGKAGTANLEQAIFNDQRPIFSKLRDKAHFQNFKIEHSTLVWSDELDLAPEYLFYLAFKDEPDLQKQFKAWGYIA